VWLHADAAYAGSAMLCPELRWVFEGVERADPLVVNAHKWMFTPMDRSLPWTSRPDDFRAAFGLTPEYLRTADSEQALSLSEIRTRPGPPLPPAEALGGAALPRAQGPAGADPPGDPAGPAIRALAA
jgi:glutamate/tyrosine decarboxylase-like PLP-dependent enzyme